MMFRFAPLLILLGGLSVNATAQAGSCSGAATPCFQFSSNYTCSQQKGCSWRSTKNECRGIATSCSAFTNANSCYGQTGCRWQTQHFADLPTVTVEDISPQDAAKLVEQGKATLIDVREIAELETTGLAAPAEWLAKSEVDAKASSYRQFLMEHDKSQPLIFYCRSGQRSGIVARHFESLGYKTLNMGSFAGWTKAGLPTKDHQSH